LAARQLTEHEEVMSLWYSAHVLIIQTTFMMFLLALSFQVVLRSGVFSFASAGFYCISAYVSANLAKTGVPGILVILIVTLGSGIVGWLVAIPLTRLRGLYLGMVTFAFDSIVTVVAINGGTFTGGAIGIFGVPELTTTTEILLCTIVAVLLVSQLERRMLGRAFELLRVDERLIRSLGFNVLSIRSFVFGISAALGALSGALYVLTFTTISPSDFNFALIISGLTMAVIGGTGSWAGTAIGTLIAVWFPYEFSVLGRYQSAWYGLLIVLVVSYQPSGIWGLLNGVYRRVIKKIGAASSRTPLEESVTPIDGGK
jgi:branched-chain amino acid transport system permease protein